MVIEEISPRPILFYFFFIKLMTQNIILVSMCESGSLSVETVDAIVGKRFR